MQIRVKRGDTLSYAVTDLDNDLSDVTVTCGVSAPGFYQALTVTEVDMENGKFTISAEPGQTTLWPIGSLMSDFKYTVDDFVIRTETFGITVNERRTV